MDSSICAIIVSSIIILCVIFSRRANRTRNQTQQQTPRTTRQTPPRQPAVNRNTETGPMVYYANDRHGRPDREYQFNYKRVNGAWRAYILRMPSLGGRDASGHVTHRLFDGTRPYICWDSTVHTLRDMQNISRVWADSIQEYIATGRRFG